MLEFKTDDPARYETEALVQTVLFTFVKDELKAEADTEEGDKIFEEYQVSFNARFLNGTQKTPEDWQDPERYAVAPEGAEAKADKPWGWNCGAEQTEYAVPPSDSAN